MTRLSSLRSKSAHAEFGKLNSSAGKPLMSDIQLISRIAFTLICFAANSVFGRLALKTTSIDPATYTSMRMLSAAAMLWMLVAVQQRPKSIGGTWAGGVALFGYAAFFSLAYKDIVTGTGALILFGAVQLCMISVSLFKGEKLSMLQWLGLALALAGLVGLVLPGIAPPPLGAAALMAAAGVAWGFYTVLGAGTPNPLLATAGNFTRTLPMSVLFLIVAWRGLTFDGWGLFYASLSGAITSALGYAIWYSVLPKLKGPQAASLQLSVPVIASLGGIVFLDEALSLRLIFASAAILFGIGLVIYERSKVPL